jgi:hypothetical protein
MPDFTVQQGTAPADFAIQSPVAVVSQPPAERSLTTLEMVAKSLHPQDPSVAHVAQSSNN